VTTTTESEYSARARINRVVSKNLDQMRMTDLKKASDYIAAQMAEDEEFVSLFIHDYLPVAVYEAATRRAMRDPEVVRVGSFAGSREDIRDEVRRQIEGNVATWLDFDPHTKTRTALLDMTRTQLLDAADRHSEKASANARRSSIYRKLAERLTGDQTVKEVWQTEEVERIGETLHATVTTATIIPFPQAAD
jgi:hypothetical protein